MENVDYLEVQMHPLHTDAAPKKGDKGRKRRLKWDKKHLRTVSTKLRKEEYCALLDACMLWGETPYSLLRRLLRSHVLGRDPGQFRRER